MVGMIGPKLLGSVPRGPNLLFPQFGLDRTETQVLEVLNANSNRTELDERAVQQFFRPV